MSIELDHYEESIYEHLSEAEVEIKIGEEKTKQLAKDIWFGVGCMQDMESDRMINSIRNHESIKINELEAKHREESSQQGYEIGRLKEEVSNLQIRLGYAHDDIRELQRGK